MLFLLLLVHTLSTSGRPVPAQHLVSRALSTGSCDDINNCRRLVDIVWGCLATIFACTWVSIHPNVPPPNQTRLGLFWRRLRMMLIAVVAPELMVGFAARQFFTARWYSKREWCSHKSELGVSNTHGFFISMGGFVSRNGHHPITTSKQLEDVAEYLADICAIEADDIKERSKGDALSKGVALIQGLWFTTQCLARVHQDLPVTELEVATLAFAIVNIPVWLLWWDKPLDVQRPIQIGPKEDREMANNEPVDNQEASVVPPGETGVNGDAKRWQTGFLGGIAGFLNGYYPRLPPEIIHLCALILVHK
ncbi:hypothetical protein B0H14DRAFT_2399746 [Mycena olivaceomarginata]|nr:hypothetical protein B0H14DRAFT_2399746 [Mycena olivaceomarginata]